jgi:hypothetical protein
MFKCGRSDLIEFAKKLKYLSHNLEIKSVVDGYRDVNVFYLNQTSYDDQIQELTDNGLFFQPLLRIKRFDGFGHKHEVVDEIGVDTSIYGAISRDNSNLKKFREYFESNDDYNMGIMLGYPECCCRGFTDYSRKFADPIYEIAQNSTREVQIGNEPINLRDVPWDLQVHMRYFDFKIIPFFPCNYYCEEAEIFAKKWYNLMYSIDADTTEKLKEVMLEPSTWSLYNSQVIVNRPPSKANFMGYATSTYCLGKKEVNFNAI